MCAKRGWVSAHCGNNPYTLCRDLNRELRIADNFKSTAWVLKPYFGYLYCDCHFHKVLLGII